MRAFSAAGPAAPSSLGGAVGLMKATPMRGASRRLVVSASLVGAGLSSTPTTPMLRQRRRALTPLLRPPSPTNKALRRPSSIATSASLTYKGKQIDSSGITLKRSLGEGSYGAVFEVRNERDDRKIRRRARRNRLRRHFGGKKKALSSSHILFLLLFLFPFPSKPTKPT